jgi:RND family efflux transporter MFP subunit
MTKRKWQIVAGAALVLVVVGLAIRTFFGGGAVTQAPAQRVVPVETARAEKKVVPVRIQALGSVTPIASVALKARLETEIVGVHFADGARVKEGDLLFTLDSRTIEAQIAQVEGALARDKAQLEGAERDVARYTDLVAKSATPVTNLDNAKTQADVFRAAIKSDTAMLNNLKVQLSYCSIRASISGRISAANVKVGNFVRPADLSPLATINQLAPVYVSFSVPQKLLPDIRQAIAAESATVEAIIPGEPRREPGQVSMIENTVDSATGMAMVRASMPNERELLWPGTLLSVDLTVRNEEAVVVPSVAVQVSQTGNFVFVVQDGVAKVVAVKVDRQVGLTTVISEGLSSGDTVVTEGHLLLSNGTRVNVRNRSAES